MGTKFDDLSLPQPLLQNYLLFKNFPTISQILNRQTSNLPKVWCPTKAKFLERKRRPEEGSPGIGTAIRCNMPSKTSITPSLLKSYVAREKKSRENLKQQEFYRTKAYVKSHV